MYQSRHLFQLLLEQLLLRLRVGFSRCLSKRSRAVLGWSGKRFQPKVTLRIEIIHSGNVILFVIGKWWVLVAGIRSINQYWMERELQAINLASHLGYSNTFRIDVSSMTPNLREEPCKIWHHVSYGARRSIACRLWQRSFQWRVARDGYWTVMQRVEAAEGRGLVAFLDTWWQMTHSSDGESPTAIHCNLQLVPEDCLTLSLLATRPNGHIWHGGLS